MMRLWAQVLAAIWLVSAAGAQSQTKLWVLQYPGEITENEGD